MAVPNTTTFDLQTVVNVVNPTSDDLTDCFADAIANKFDPAYSGGKNNLLNFRNYDAGISNTLVVETTSSGFPPTYFAYITNQSVDNQVITFTWKYVSQSADISATVSYDGVNRAVGYTTPTITGNIDNIEGVGAFTIPFSITGGNAAQLYFEFTLLTAATDTVPSSPNNKTTVGYCQNCN